MSASSAFDAPADELRRRTTSGVLQTGLSQGVRLLLQLASVVLLSRLLAPSEFGLLAMASPVVAFASLLGDLGLAQAVVQKPKLGQAEVSALFWISLGAGAGLAAALVAASPAVGAFYREPRAAALTAAMGAPILVGSAGSLHGALLNRRMQFRAMAVIDAAAALGGLAVSVAFALACPSVWALYAGSLAASAIPAAGCWIASGWRPSWPRRQPGLAVALGFGANVTGFNVANFFSRNLDNVLIGRRWGEGPLGLYDRAYKLLLLPLQQVNGPVAKVMLPVLAQMSGEPERYSRAFLRVLAQMLLVTLPGVAFMVGTADLLVPLLLGRQWAGASGIFTVLGIAGLVQALNNPTGWLFISQDRTRDYMRWGLFSSATCIASFLAGLPYGPAGVAAAYAGGECLRTPLLWWHVTRRGPVTLGAAACTVLPHYSGAAASAAAVMGARALLPLAPLPMLAACLAASFLASAAVVGLFPRGRETIGQTIGLARRLLLRSAG